MFDHPRTTPNEASAPRDTRPLWPIPGRLARRSLPGTQPSEDTSGHPRSTPNEISARRDTLPLWPIPGRLARRSLPGIQASEDTTSGHPSTPNETSARRDTLPLWPIPGRLVAPLLNRRRRRAAIADLDGLCDHLLADIGLSRNDIPTAVDALLEQDPAADSGRNGAVAAAAQSRDAVRRTA